MGRVDVGVTLTTLALIVPVELPDKTFVATLVRESGTGNMSHNAMATQPAYLYVDYIRG